MFENMFATYNKVLPPLVSDDFFNIQNEPSEDFNPIAELYNNLITYETKESEQDTVKLKDSKKPTSKKVSTKPKTTSTKALVGDKGFEQAFQQALKINPNIGKYKNFLTRTAKRESGFKSNIQNTTGAPYYGYFLMGKSEIASTTGMSVDQFRNDPVAQILGACKLYESNLNTIKKLGVYELGKQKGYTDDALISGAWIGGPGGVKKYLLGKGDPSDSHWYGGKGGSSVGKIMNGWMNV